MAWFTPDAWQFFADISEHNDREWFAANKMRYEESVKKPLEAFAAEMIPRMRELDPRIDTLPKNAAFRIQRDTRFSKDKSPYKEHAAMVIAPGGRHEPGVTGLYFHFSHLGVSIASGCYFLEAAQLHAIRAHIVANPDEFRRLREDPVFVEHFGEIQGERNKIAPADFKAAAAGEPMILNKQFFYWRELPVETLLREDLPDLVIDHMRACAPLNEFLTRPLR